MSKIYIVFRDADLTEGRGPMVRCSGYFKSEAKAWAFADTLTGVMGRKPDGSWKISNTRDVDVKEFEEHTDISLKKGDLFKLDFGEGCISTCKYDGYRDGKHWACLSKEGRPGLAPFVVSEEELKKRL